MERIAINMFCICIAAALVAVSSPRLRELRASHPVNASAVSEVLYVPHGPGLELVSFGYKNALSQVLWFKTISYFAGQYRGDRDYRWLSHMCGLVTRLNPRMEHVYHFCALMLAWEGNLPEKAIEVLDDAAEKNPHNWLYLYLRGFLYVYFLHDEERGARDFKAASILPGVHPLVVRLAGRKMMDLESPESAIEFLTQTLAVSRDEHSRRVISDRLLEAQFEIGFRDWERAIENFRNGEGRGPASLEEVMALGYVARERASIGVRDVYGGMYSIDPASGEVRSSARERPRKLRWNRPRNGDVQ